MHDSSMSSDYPVASATACSVPVWLTPLIPIIAVCESANHDHNHIGENLRQHFSDRVMTRLAQIRGLLKWTGLSWRLNTLSSVCLTDLEVAWPDRTRREK